MISLTLSLIGHHPWYIKTAYPHSHYNIYDANFNTHYYSGACIHSWYTSDMQAIFKLNNTIEIMVPMHSLVSFPLCFFLEYT